MLAAAFVTLPTLVLPSWWTFNHSASLPRGLYWYVSAPRELRRGTLACFEYVAPAWAESRHYFPAGAQLCKVVLGLPGDRVVRNGSQVSVCGPAECHFVGRLLSTDSHGRKAVAADLPAVIPPRKFYLGSNRVLNSFDSRYLGLIDQAAITRVIYPLVTEGG